MSFLLDNTEKMYNSDNYLFYSKHRSTSNNNASRWVIEMNEELLMCENAIKKGYIQPHSPVKKFAYNLIRESHHLKIIGVSATKNQNINLKIAKFNNDVSNNMWHGYPANHIANNQDKPIDSILSEMVKNGLITKQEMRRIKKGLKI